MLHFLGDIQGLFALSQRQASQSLNVALGYGYEMVRRWGYQLGRGQKNLGGGRAGICSVYPALTPHEINAYAEQIRLTPHELFSNRKLIDQFKRFKAYSIDF